MKKILIIGLAAMVLLMMAVPAVLAIEIDIDSFDPVAVDTLKATISWDGIGYVDIDALVNDDASVDFFTVGAHISGSLYLGDAGEQFGVSSFTTSARATVDDGWIEYGVERLDAYNPGYYGEADQSTYSLIGSSGSASLSFQTHTAYASFHSSNYLPPHDNFLADGEEYEAYHEVVNGEVEVDPNTGARTLISGNWAWFSAGGDGTLDIDYSNDVATGQTRIDFGRHEYAYPNAGVTQTGSGYFEVGGYFENSVSGGYDDTWDVTPSWTVGGPVTYLQSFDFSDGFSWTDYSFNGN